MAKLQLNLLTFFGVDGGEWLEKDLRRSRRAPLDRPLRTERGARPTTLEHHFESEHCVLCDAPARPVGGHCTLCDTCRAQMPSALLTLQTRHTELERRCEQIQTHCASCAGVGRTHGEWKSECRSIDCPHLYTRLKLERQRGTAREHLARALAELPPTAMDRPRAAPATVPPSW